MPTFNNWSCGAGSRVNIGPVPSSAMPQRRFTAVLPNDPKSRIPRKIAVSVFPTAFEATYIPGIGHSLREHSVVLIRGGRETCPACVTHHPQRPGCRWRCQPAPGPFLCGAGIQTKWGYAATSPWAWFVVQA